MNDIKFKNTFDKIDFDIAMKMYMKHNSRIASINDHLGEMYSYKDLEEASALEKHDTLQEYKKALKEKCDAIDKAIEYINEEAKSLVAGFGMKKCINTYKLLDILRGESNE